MILYANGTAIQQKNGAEPLSFSVSPADGTVEYVAQALDGAGNVSFFTAPINVTFDRTTIPVTVTLDPADEDSSYGPGANTTHNQVTLDGTAKAGSTVIVVGTPLVTRADSTGHYFLSGVPVHPGVNTLVVRSTDSAGNTAESNALTVTMHNITPPAITMSLVNDTGFSSTDLITSDPTTKVVVDDVSPITLLQASINNGPSVNVLSDLTGDLLTLTGPLLQQINGGSLPDGELVIQVQAGDSDGNVSQPASLDILLQRTPPPSNLAPSLVTASDTGSNPFATDPSTSDNTPELRLFAARTDLVTFYDGSTMIGQNFSTGVAEVTTLALSDGIHTITATIEDQAGNVGGPTPALMLNIYTVPPTAPTLTLDPSQQDPVRANYTTAAQVTLYGHTQPEAGEPPATVQLVGLNLTTTADAGGNFTFTNVPLAVGANALTAQASDLAGNTSQVTLTLTRGLMLPPAITAQAVGRPVRRRRQRHSPEREADRLLPGRLRPRRAGRQRAARPGGRQLQLQRRPTRPDQRRHALGRPACAAPRRNRQQRPGLGRHRRLLHPGPQRPGERRDCCHVQRRQRPVPVQLHAQRPGWQRLGYRPAVGARPARRHD